jgi:plastocyanin
MFLDKDNRNYFFTPRSLYCNLKFKKLDVTKSLLNCSTTKLINKVMKTLKLLLVVSILMIASRANSAVVIINQTGTSFSPSNVSVNVGDVIRWVWSSNVHTTTSITIPNGAASWNGALNSSNPIFEYTISVAGNYTYECTIHSGMNGSINAASATSVDIKNLNEFRIFPNPSSSIINLPIDLQGNLYLFDVIGNELKQILPTDLKTNSNSSQLNISGLAIGVYFITYIPDNSRKRVTWKFVKK